MGVALTVTLCPFATGVNELVFSVTVNVTGEPGLRLTGEGGENEQDTSVGGVGQPSATGPEKVVVERVNDAGPLGFPETAETKLGDGGDRVTSTTVRLTFCDLVTCRGTSVPTP